MRWVQAGGGSAVFTVYLLSAAALCQIRQFSCLCFRKSCPTLFANPNNKHTRRYCIQAFRYPLVFFSSVKHNVQRKCGHRNTIATVTRLTRAFHHDRLASSASAGRGPPSGYDAAQFNTCLCETEPVRKRERRRRRQRHALQTAVVNACLNEQKNTHQKNLPINSSVKRHPTQISLG